MISNFGEQFGNVWPKCLPKYTEFGLKLMEKCKNVKKPEKVEISKIIDRSNSFSVQFPIETCRIKNQPKTRFNEIENQINSAYPIIHERTLWLYCRFLEHKLKYGTEKEKEVYNNLSICGFVNRLLTKRCVSFFGRNDKFLLKSGHRGASGFVPVGTMEEQPPLILKNCLSYDEIKLSALMYVTSNSEFLNDGNRNNVGVVEKNKAVIEISGVIIGLIGARLSRRGLMEFQDIIINKKQNVMENGYGLKEQSSSDKNIMRYDYRKIWNEFYDEKDFLYTDVKKDDKRFSDLKNKDDIFDNLVMKKRYTIPFDVLLLESESRAAAIGKKAYIHVVGIGLGVWKVSDQQHAIFLETFSQRLKVLLPVLKNVAFIHFSWFKLKKWKDLSDGAFFADSGNVNGGIRIFISNRNPADKLVLPELENCFVVQSYAWDGNALPGNEFWMKMLNSTGDSAAACSTLITEIHNPFINNEIVNGDNLHIASEKFGVIHIGDYTEKLL